MLIHLAGAIALVEHSSGPVVRIAAVQPHILLGERDTAAGRAEVLDRLTQLTRAAGTSKPALIVWPETAIATNVRADPFMAAELSALAQEVQAPIVFGAGEVEKFTSRTTQGAMQRRAYNSAYVVSLPTDCAPLTLNASSCPLASTFRSNTSSDGLLGSHRQPSKK